MCVRVRAYSACWAPTSRMDACLRTSNLLLVRRPRTPSHGRHRGDVQVQHPAVHSSWDQIFVPTCTWYGVRNPWHAGGICGICDTGIHLRVLSVRMRACTWIDRGAMLVFFKSGCGCHDIFAFHFLSPINQRVAPMILECRQSITAYTVRLHST